MALCRCNEPDNKCYSNSMHATRRVVVVRGDGDGVLEWDKSGLLCRRDVIEEENKVVMRF